MALIYPSLLLKKTISIFPNSSSQITLLGKFLIRGKLYFKTLTLIVCIFPTSNLSRVAVFDLSVDEYGKCHSKSLIFT